MHTNFIVNFKQADFDRHNAEMQNHIAELDYRSRLKGWILFFAAILIISILIFLGAQLNTNRKLKARTRLLHDQLSAAAKQDERWVDTVPAMTSDKVNDRDTEMEEGSGPDGGNAKYQGSLLADEEKERIAAKIRDVVTNSNEIYSSDFTLARLAGMVGSTSKYVSQVVNEKFGCNFWTLVNRARIREAMRRLDDLRNYSDWSIEGIAESVGFRSRSTFTSWFRKFAGMSAAEYRQHSNE